MIALEATSYPIPLIWHTSFSDNRQQMVERGIIKKRQTGSKKVKKERKILIVNL